jgi:hypothetical protein
MARFGNNLDEVTQPCIKPKFVWVYTVKCSWKKDGDIMDFKMVKELFWSLSLNFHNCCLVELLAK